MKVLSGKTSHYQILWMRSWLVGWLCPGMYKESIIMAHYLAGILWTVTCLFQYTEPDNTEPDKFVHFDYRNNPFSFNRYFSFPTQPFKYMNKTNLHCPCIKHASTNIELYLVLRSQWKLKYLCPLCMTSFGKIGRNEKGI